MPIVQRLVAKKPWVAGRASEDREEWMELRAQKELKMKKMKEMTTHETIVLFCFFRVFRFVFS